MPPWWNWYTRQVEGLCPYGRARSSRAGGIKLDFCSYPPKRAEWYVVCNWPARAVRRGRPQRREISIAVSTIDVRRLIGIYSAVAGQKAELGRQNHN